VASAGGFAHQFPDGEALTGKSICSTSARLRTTCSRSLITERPLASGNFRRRCMIRRPSSRSTIGSCAPFTWPRSRQRPSYLIGSLLEKLTANREMDYPTSDSRCPSFQTSRGTVYYGAECMVDANNTVGVAFGTLCSSTRCSSQGARASSRNESVSFILKWALLI